MISYFTVKIASTMHDVVIKSLTRRWVIVLIAVLMFPASMFRILLGFVAVITTLHSERHNLAIFVLVKGLCGAIFWLGILCRKYENPRLNIFTYFLGAFSFIWQSVGSAWTFEHHLETDGLVFVIQVLTIVDWSLFACVMCIVCVSTSVILIRNN
ncbi:uncharacterized protein LOC123539412 [Mercenaria mercenaria]|uniref:uncharacterized protein LOC123539412 n=1 Tax=Mercenaria mercenaria TaxID=6596 RepID=UPI00234F02BC|nr:uncharacterized protein LOC123539412 [Mercenaria mercenaria]